jgi:hypothetical protein
MARRRKAPLVPAAAQALDRLKGAIARPPRPPQERAGTVVERFRRLARELVERERLR